MFFITLPYIGTRRYVHSSSFVNCIFDLFPNLNSASFTFSNLSKDTSLILKISSSPLQGAVHGVIDKSIYFAFTSANMELDIPTIIAEPPTTNIENLNRTNFIWNAVANFKHSYQPHFDSTTGQPVIAKIEIMNFDKVSWPAKFDYTMRFTPTRTVCNYTYNGLAVCRQIGITSNEI